MDKIEEIKNNFTDLLSITDIDELQFMLAELSEQLYDLIDTIKEYYKFINHLKTKQKKETKSGNKIQNRV